MKFNKSFFGFFFLKKFDLNIESKSGVSRSAAVAIAYKMQHEKKTFDVCFVCVDIFLIRIFKKYKLFLKEAHQELKTARPDVDPNDGFIEQVCSYV